MLSTAFPIRRKKQCAAERRPRLHSHGSWSRIWHAVGVRAVWRNVRTMAVILCFSVALAFVVRPNAKQAAAPGDPSAAASDSEAASREPRTATAAAGHFSPSIAASIDTSELTSGPFTDIFNAHVVWDLDGEGGLHAQWIPDFAMRVPTKLNAEQARAALAMLDDEDRIVAGHFILGSLIPEAEVTTELVGKDDRIDRYHCRYLGLTLDVDVHHTWMPPRRRMMLRHFPQQRDALRVSWTEELVRRGLLDKQ
ncbi:hypothetical protein VT03_20425 [Planctomyces sp. SH-PL14]|nr:hypothetical protein VT03_20425 [Planctomyces sp. SH-PL14]